MHKLVLVIVNRDKEKVLTRALIREKFLFTRLGSSGGYLRKKNATLLLGVEENNVEPLIALITKVAHERDGLIAADQGATLGSESGMPDLPLGAAPLKVGGVTIFVLPVEKVVRG